MAASANRRRDGLAGVTPLAREEASGDTFHQSVTIVHDNLVVVRMTGTLCAGPELNRLTDFLEGRLRSATRAKVFFDLEGFHRYESDVRVRYTNAIRAHLGNTEAVYVYADAKLVRMGATVAGLVLPQLRLIGREEFDDRLAAALEED